MQTLNPATVVQDGVTYMCAESLPSNEDSGVCIGCWSFHNHSACPKSQTGGNLCFSSNRPDKTNVIFIKIGEL